MSGFQWQSQWQTLPCTTCLNFKTLQEKGLIPYWNLFQPFLCFIMINGWNKTICSAFIITNNIEGNLTPTVFSFFNNTIQWQKGYEILCRDLYLSWTGWNIDNGNSLGRHWYNRKQHMTCSSEQCAVTTNYIPIHTQHIKSLFVSLLLWALYLWLLYHLK